MTERLNPKLTRRSVRPQASYDTVPTTSRSNESNTDSFTGTDFTEESSQSDGGPVLENTNPRLHLLHNGQWVPKQYNVGRQLPRTGVWTCCGETDHYSLYCESLEARDLYVDGLDAEDEGKIREVENTSKRRAQLMNHILEAEKTKEVVIAPLTKEEMAIEEACTEEGSFNAPMLVAWLLKHHHEEPTTLNGLRFLLKHLSTGEGCFLMHRHGVLHAVIKIHEFYRNQPPIQLLVASVVKQLLDCNFTRSAVVSNVNILLMCFSIAHNHMNSASHVETACKCITQCARSEQCRVAILDHNILPYMINFCKKFSKNPHILRATLMLMYWLTTNQARLEYVCSVHGVNTALQCMKRHASNPKVLSPAILFLARAAQNHPFSMEMLLKKNAAALVIEALKLVHSDDAVQLEGLKLLQIISRTSEGWQQISAVSGGWQSITQGTLQGDALVHDLPGAFNNPGWSVGDTPYLPLLDRQKLAAAKSAQSGIKPEIKAAWTPSSLREYMGLSMAGQTLAINTEHHNVYYELLVTLDMLPKPGEEREAWFQRVHAYEVESEVKIDDMVGTVQEMRRREAVHKKMAAKGIAMSAFSDEILGTVKEVYVNGELVTGEILAAADADIGEALDGIV